MHRLINNSLTKMFASTLKLAGSSTGVAVCRVCRGPAADFALLCAYKHKNTYRIHPTQNLGYILLSNITCRSLSSSSTSSSTSSLSSSSSFSSDRLSASSLSMDIAIYQNPEVVKSHLKSRCKSELEEAVDTLLKFKESRNNLISKGNLLRNQKKNLSATIGKLLKEKAGNDVISEQKRQVELITAESLTLDAQLADIESQMRSLQLVFPNLLDDRVPDGSDDCDNIVVSTWGDGLRKLYTPSKSSNSNSSNSSSGSIDSENDNPDNPYKWHDVIANGIGGLQSDAASRLSGTRFSVLVGPLARLERALIQYFLDFHASRGYTEVSVPYIVSRSTLEGTGQLPKFEEDLFKVSHKVGGEDAFLIPTSEVPVTSLLRDQIVDASTLPLRYVCYSPCFRAEAGSKGRDTRGLLRQHQFHKVELVKICKPESSDKEHHDMVEDAEEILRNLKLPYRKLLLCSGDVGFSARLCYDLEVWLPSQQIYREVSSISNCHDFQSRRMKLRCRLEKKSDEKVHPHTINGSGVAIGRALVAILENYQNSDGSVTIPEQLVPYMGGLTILHKKSNV